MKLSLINERLLRRCVRDLINETLLVELRLLNDEASSNKSYRAFDVLMSGDDVSFQSSGQFLIVPVSEKTFEVERRYKLALNKPHNYLLADFSLVVDHDLKTIDLDVSEYSDYKTRRQSHTSHKAHFIPHADVAFENKSRLKKLLSALTSVDKQLTGDYLIVGNPTYDTMTVGDILKSISLQQNIVSGSKFKPIIMYHGTSEARYKIIKSKGLSPGNASEAYVDLIPGYSEHNVYLTTSVSIAENYATRAAVDDRSKAVVLKVVVKDSTKFVLDEDNAGVMVVKVPLDGRDDYKYPENMEKNDWMTQIHFAEKSWKKWSTADNIMQQFQMKMIKSVANKHSIGYKGTIKPTDISVHSMYKPASMKKDPSKEEYELAREKTMSTFKRH